MTEQHPLTDEICEELVPFCLETEYDYIVMRAAADWQLEQVIQAWEQYLEEPGTYTQAIRRFDQKLKAMRPTTTQENTDD